MENKEDLTHLADIVVEEAGYVGLRISESKRKCHWASRRGASCDQNEPLKINEYTFRRTEQFSYLEVTLTDCKMENNDIKHRLNTINRSFHTCSKLLYREHYYHTPQ